MELDIQYLLGKRVIYKFRPVTKFFPFRLDGPTFEYGPEEEKLGTIVGWCIEEESDFHLIISFQDGIKKINSREVRLAET
jgi:hypothetical protein